MSGQVSEWIKLPKVFVNLISHSKVKLVGLNIAGWVFNFAILKHFTLQLINKNVTTIGVGYQQNLNFLVTTIKPTIILKNI